MLSFNWSIARNVWRETKWREKMARNATAVSTENRTIKQTSGKIQKKGLHKKVRYLYSHLLPTQAACLYLFTIGLLRKKSRALIYDIWMMVCPRVFSKKYIPPVAVTSLVSKEVSLHLYEQEDDTVGNISFEELLILVELVQTRQPATCFEIGTYDGRTALNMAANTPEDAVIYTLDLPREEIASTLFPLDPFDLKVVKK